MCGTRLRAVDDGDDAAPARLAADLRDRIDGAEHVRDVRDAEQLHLRRHRCTQRVEVELAVGRQLGDADRARRCARATSCHGTMLAWCSMRVSRIASPGFSRGSAQRVRDQVDREGRAAGEHQVVAAHVEEGARACRARPRRRRSLRCRACAPRATDVGVVAAVERRRPCRSPTPASARCWRSRGRPAACRGPRARAAGSRARTRAQSTVGAIGASGALMPASPARRARASSAASAHRRSAGVAGDGQHLAAERGGQQARAPAPRGNAARAQVEQRGRVEPADGRAVRGLALRRRGSRSTGCVSISASSPTAAGSCSTGAASLPSAPARITMPPWKTARPRSAARPRQSRSQRGVAGDVVDAQARVDVAAAAGEQHAVGLDSARRCPRARRSSSWRDSARAEFEVDAAVARRRARARRRCARAGSRPSASSCTRACSSDAPSPRSHVRAAGCRGCGCAPADEVMLDQRQAARRRRARSRWRRCHGEVAAGRRADEHQVQRRFDVRAGGDAQQRAVGGQRGVEPREHFVGALEAGAQAARRRRSPAASAADSGARARRRAARRAAKARRRTRH